MRKAGDGRASASSSESQFSTITQLTVFLFTKKVCFYQYPNIIDLSLYKYFCIIYLYITYIYKFFSQETIIQHSTPLDVFTLITLLCRSFHMSMHLLPHFFRLLLMCSSFECESFKQSSIDGHFASTFPPKITNNPIVN